MDNSGIAPPAPVGDAQPRSAGPIGSPPVMEPPEDPQPPSRSVAATLVSHVISSENYIKDDLFIQDLNRLKELRSFLIQEAANIGATESGALEFGRLNMLRRAPFSDAIVGREPTEQEWRDVERLTRTLFALLTPALRRRFVLGAVPKVLAWSPLFLGVAALISLIMSIKAYTSDILRMGSVGANVLPFYLVWLLCLGAIGAIAFIGMNALSVQEDITFDLTNRRLIAMRISLGALFGLVLTLPFGFGGFIDFCRTIVVGGKSIDDAKGISTIQMQAGVLVLPFVLGFSTSLVILILNRFVDAVQGFFGRRPSDRPVGDPITETRKDAVLIKG